MPTLREPAVAGLFYPDNPQELRAQVSQYLAAATPRDLRPKALIAPHAGYIYSGPVAGSAYRLLAGLAAQIRRVVLLGPAHRLAFQGLAFASASGFRTPLGTIPVDREALESLRCLPQVRESDAPFAGEHSLEVHLPFLQTQLRDFQLVPLLVGDATGEEVAEVLEHLWGGDETLILISSDLSHYLGYTAAQDCDAAASRAIEALRPQDLRSHQACGRIPIRGLLREAQRRGLHALTLDLRNSGDTAGPRDRVVGYGAYAFVA